MPRRSPLAAYARTLLPWVSMLLLAAAMPLQPAHAQDAVPPGRVDLQLALEQSSGRYNEAAPTRIRTSTMVARYRAQTWVGEIQVPWVEVRSANATGGLPGTAQGGGKVERGLGDIWLKLGVELQAFSADGVGVDLTLKAKSRSGDSTRGLGTGGTDVAAQIELLRQLGPLTGFAHVGYRRTGDLPGFAAYRNPWYGGVGAYYAAAPTLEIGAFTEVREPVSRLGSLREASLYAAWLSGAQRMQIYLTRGFAPASADWALGLSLRHRF